MYVYLKFTIMLTFKRSIYLLFSFSLFFIYTSCNKKSADNIHFDKLELSKKETLKSWLNLYGQSYKDGNIIVKSNEGLLLNGELDWNKMQTYEYKGREYIEVPYVFDNKFISPIKDKDGSNLVSFHLVLRSSINNGFEAAIRNTNYNSTLKDSEGNEINKTTQSYFLLNGKESTLWVSDNKGTFLKATRQSRLLKYNKSSNFIRSSNCRTYSFVEYSSVECHGQSGPSDYNIICSHTYHYSYLTICENGQDEEEHDFGDDWGDGGGGDSGYGSKDSREEDEFFENTLYNVTPSYSGTAISLLSQDSETRKKKYQWTHSKGPVFNVVSTEIGEHKKVSHDDPKKQWEWKSLVHSTLSLQGIVIKGKVTTQLNSAVPTLGIYNANIEVNFTLISTFEGKGVAVTKYDIKNNIQYFNVNQ